MIALGGVACALGGAAWGASGLAGQPSTHLTVSLLMIGKFLTFNILFSKKSRKRLYLMGGLPCKFGIYTKQ
jgi:hypothetical protein